MNPVLSNEVVDELRLKCMVCQKAITGFYARFGDSGVCSAKHMREVDAERKEASRIANEKFIERFGL